MIQYLLYSLVLFYYLPPFSLKQMAGDRKGKAKVDEQPKKKKRTREERDWERAHAAAAAAERPQRPLQIRESRAATQGESEPDAEAPPGTPTLCRSARTRAAAQTPPARGGPRVRCGRLPRPGGRTQPDTAAQTEDEPDSEPEDKSGVRSVFLIDIREFTVTRVRRMRYVDEQTWFPDQRDRDTDSYFHTHSSRSLFTSGTPSSGL